jgi:hypothetical protein
MAHRTSLRRIATLVAGVLLFAQLAVAAYACPLPQPIGGADMSTVDAGNVSAMPGCNEPMSTLDPASPNLCAEHCKQGQQSDRASFGIVVPPALLNALYEAPAVREPVHEPPQPGAWLSALVAASPPHAIAHCVLRI